MAKQKSIEGFRVSADGRYTGFIYHDRKTQVTTRYGYKQGWPQNIYSLEKAKIERGRVLAKIDARMTEAAQRIAWQKKYSDFDLLSDEYSSWIKDSLKRKTVESYLSNVKNYVFYFFIEQENLNNIETWPQNFKGFRNFLNEAAALKISKKLSTNSKNNCVKALNSFLKFMEEEHSKGPFPRCKEFKTGKEDRRGLDDLYSDQETKKLINGAKSAVLAGADGDLYSLFLKLLAQSGMRANECLGMHVGSFTFGEIPDAKRALFKRISEAGYSIYGYILLTDQPELVSIYDEHGKVPRGPLKARKEIAPEYNRYIPLLDEETATELANLVSRRRKEKKGPKEDNLIFGFTYADVYKVLLELRASGQIKEDADLHSIRHSFSTALTKACQGDKTVSAEVLGQSERIAERYIHLNEEIERDRRQESDEKLSPTSKVKKVSF